MTLLVVVSHGFSSTDFFCLIGPIYTSVNELRETTNVKNKALLVWIIMAIHQRNRAVKICFFANRNTYNNQTELIL